MSPRGGGGTAARDLRRAVGLFAAVLVGYSAGAILSWQAFGGTIGGPAFFPAAGVTVAALLLNPRSLWPAVVAAIAVAEFLIDLRSGEAAWLAAGYVVANAVEPLAGAMLTLVWCRGTPDLRQRADLSRFVAAACLAGPLIGGLMGGAITSVNSGSWFPAAVMHWFVGDSVGVLVVATPILLWGSQFHILRGRPLETVAMLASTAVLSVVAFATTAPPAMLILPVLAWAAFRLDMLGAALSGALIALAANLMTTAGRGPFADLSAPAPTRLALTQAFIAVSFIGALLIAQEVAGRTVAVRARESERRERLRLQALAGLAQQLSAAMTPQDIGRALAEQVINEAGARAVNLGLLSADGRTLEWVAMEGHPDAVVREFGGGVPMADRTVATDVARTGEPILIRTSAEYGVRYPAKSPWLRLSGAQTVVGWPLTAGPAPIGVLLLVWQVPQPFDTAQRSYVSAVATMVGQALARARIYSDEHARAAVLQAAVLPGTPAGIPGVDLCIGYDPADLVEGLGGDWYDVMPLPANRTYFAVGDVVGHGLQAVEDMAQLRAAGRALAHQGMSPARLLADLNGFTRDASQGRFATMAVVVFDHLSATLSYCTAGHPPPLLRRAATGEVLRLSDAGGPVLGPLPEATFADVRIPVCAGDILVLYTDGLVERRGTDIDDGIERARRLIADWPPDSAMSGNCGRLQEALAPRPRSDDICVIAMRFTGQAVGAGSAG